MTELEAAIIASKTTGEILRKAWGEQSNKVQYKSPVDLVTEYDRKAEQVIAELLYKYFPDYGFMAEEGTQGNDNQDVYWIVDPLDGTTNFSRRYPWFAISIALVKNRKLLLGVVYNPINDELFVGELGKGATLNGQTIRVSGVNTIHQALLTSGFYYDTYLRSNRNIEKWMFAIQNAIGVRCDGSAALDLCSVACGRYDGYWEEGLDSWDVAAGALIVQEAGGLVTDYQGGDNYLFGKQIVAAPPSLHAEMLQYIVRS
ncbi:MAG: inositol monophosphatase family protein [Candidatus Kryptoniota bacterium]